MKFSTNLLSQILLTAGNVWSLVGGVVPPKYQVLVVGILGGIQTVVSAVSHYSNPNGTPATEPFKQ